MIRRPPRSTLDRSSAASDVYKRQNTDSPSTSLRYAQDERGFGGVELTETAFSTKRACPTCGESYPELGPLNGPAAAYTAAQPASSPAAVRPERSLSLIHISEPTRPY